MFLTNYIYHLTLKKKLIVLREMEREENIVPHIYTPIDLLVACALTRG